MRAKVFAAVLVGAVAAGGGASAHAEVRAVAAGEATLVDTGGARLRSGGSRTVFTIRLPSGAACPGDSANDGYRVQSYMVPSSVAPGEVEYDGLGPTPNVYGDFERFRQALYDIQTSPFSSGLTAEAPKPGEPGVIVNIPLLSFAVYQVGELPPGRYNLGIACTLRNEPVRYWNTELDVRGAADDRPAGIAWSVASGEGAAEGSRRPLTSVIGGAALVVLAAFALARRRSVAR